MASKIQLRRDSSSNWRTTNPVLAEGEMGVELDTNRSKLGDGTSNWNDILYMTDTNAVGTYDAKYLIKNANVGDQTVVSTGTTTFNGRGEFGGGVKVTGGGAGSVVDGIAKQGNNLTLAVDSTPLLKISNQFGVVSNETKDTDTNTSDYFNAGPSNTATITNLSGFRSAPTTNTGTVTVYRGFSATDSNTDFGTTSYGFYSNLGEGVNTNYNFYAAGDAPNYFYGKIELAPNPRTVSEALDNNSKNGIILSRSGAVLQKVQNGKTGIQISKFENGPVLIINGLNSGNPSGNLVNKSVFTITNTGITATNLSATRLADARVVTLTPYSDATALVKQLNPGQEGFLAPNVALVDSSAVHGEENATEAIGTLADYDGTVLETEVTEPNELTYTEDVETDGVTTQVVRTRTWTATGTRPVYQGVDQTKLIPLLTKALQEALERIEVLEAKLGPEGASVAASTTKKK